MKREATISPCGSYRYDLTRTVEPGCPCVRCDSSSYARSLFAPNLFPYVLWVLCNPSMADAEIDDATERRGWGFTSSWGYPKMVFVNTNPYRSTNPRQARTPGRLITDHNEGFLIRHALEASLIICAWGTNAESNLACNAEYAMRLAGAGSKIHTLGLTKGGVPKHPLYLSKDTEPQLWKL